MLYQQTLEKLRALRREGMALALEEQRTQNAIIELDFEDRLGLLVERQCLWKENRGLVIRDQCAVACVHARSLTSRAPPPQSQICLMREYTPLPFAV